MKGFRKKHKTSFVLMIYGALQTHTKNDNPSPPPKKKGFRVGGLGKTRTLVVRPLKKIGVCLPLITPLLFEDKKRRIFFSRKFAVSSTNVYLFRANEQYCFLMKSWEAR